MNTTDDAARALELEGNAGGKKRTWMWLGAFLVLGALGGGAYFQYGKADGGGYRFRTEEAKRGSLTILVTATGALEPVNQVVVGSELSGTIAQVDVDFNDTVKRGQILARLNTDQIQTRVAQARANLGAANAKLEEEQANFTEFEREFDRCKKLSPQGLCTPQKLDTVRAAFLRSKAKLAAARAQVDHAVATLDADEMDIQKATIRSPIDGVILNRNIESGQTVAASFQSPDLFTIAEDLRRMELHVDVDEADVGRVLEGQRARFTVDAYPDKTFPAQIKQLRYAPQRVDGVVTYKALLSVDNTDLYLRPGMTATADIVTRRVKDALLVPNAALRFTPPDPNKVSKADRQGASMLAGSMPWHPRRAPVKKNGGPKSDSGGKSKVWIMRDGKPAAIPIVSGMTDGRVTEILEGEIEAGMELLIDVVGSDR
ncbi:MAG: efflux RND transporter periplasmic adaptor subunit [Rhodospirillales bacterium]|nr:efflux RND transporter periplasmic adaptor subunit [Rhodospirillales bacterium]MCW8953155.1 efflux RND transporter periplasmic adaptor subunit [Rhodospirillales bacterium]